MSTTPIRSVWCNVRLSAGGGLSCVCTLEKGHEGPQRGVDLVRIARQRREIDAMAKGDVLVFNGGEYFNAYSSVSRLNEAYDGERVWTMARSKGVIRITRTK